MADKPQRFPEPPGGARDLIDCIIEPMMKAKLLLTALEMDLFTGLKAPKTAKEVAAPLGTHHGNTGFFLDGLSACGFLVKEGERYTNAKGFAPFLDKDSQFYVGAGLLSNYRWIAPGMEKMKVLLEKGPDGKNRISAPQTWVDATAGLAQLQKSGGLHQVRHMVTALDGFAGFEKMLDLGCGAGLIGMSVIDAHPAMSGVFFDIPQVIELTAAYVKEYDMEDRIRLMGGDMLRDDIGTGYDLILASQSLSFAKADLDGMMGKMYRALNPGGVLVSLNGVYDREAPAPHILNTLGTIMAESNFMLAKGAVARAAERAGFARVTRLDSPPGMDVDLAVK